MHFLAVMANAEDCRDACFSRPDCLSYCYVGHAISHRDRNGEDRSGRCYARSDQVWLPQRLRQDVFSGCDRTRVEALGKQWCAPTYKNMTRGNQMHCVEVASFTWPNAIPHGCPLAKSPLALRFTGHGCSAVADNSADTVYFMEGANGTLYTGWADGHQGKLEVACSGPSASTGWSIFNGSSPRDLRLVDHGT